MEVYFDKSLINKKIKRKFHVHQFPYGLRLKINENLD